MVSATGTFTAAWAQRSLPRRTRRCHDEGAAVVVRRAMLPSGGAAGLSSGGRMGRGIARTLAALALTIAGLTASTAAPASSAPVSRMAAPVADELDGIWCASQKSCLAVGANISGPSPLAEAWNGLTWKKVAVKLP